MSDTQELTSDLEAEVFAAAEKIVGDFGRHDTKAYFAGFAPDATFIFHTHSERLDSRAAYEALWSSWESSDGFRVHSCRSLSGKVQILGVEAAVFSHRVESQIEFAGVVETVRERETIVFHRQAAGWVAVHEHLSPETSSEDSA